MSTSIAVVADGASDGVAVMTGSTGQMAMNMGAAGMCMAVLVLSLLMLLLGLYASRVRPWMWLVARPVRSLWVRGHDPDPPSLFRLSIQRC
jgi:multidrug efflux pump subunit AcrB